MNTIDIHINIGSNSGHREALIGQAVAAISSAFPGEISCSELVETPPWGFDSPNPFLNIGLMLRISDAGAMSSSPAVRQEYALGVLRRLQEIQSSIDPSPHRDADGCYIDRAIDIDLIAIGDWVIDTPDLTLPHPRMHLRDFVLIPLSALAPAWRHPLTGKTAEEHLSELNN